VTCVWQHFGPSDAESPQAQDRAGRPELSTNRMYANQGLGSYTHSLARSLRYLRPHASFHFPHPRPGLPRTHPESDSCNLKAGTCKSASHRFHSSLPSRICNLQAGNRKGSKLERSGSRPSVRCDFGDKQRSWEFTGRYTDFEKQETKENTYERLPQRAV